MIDKPGNLYAVHNGDYAGQLFALVKKEEHCYNCLRMPDMKNISVPKDDFKDGKKKEIIRFIEKAPKEVFDVITAQYEKNSNN